MVPLTVGCTNKLYIIWYMPGYVKVTLLPLISPKLLLVVDWVLMLVIIELFNNQKKIIFELATEFELYYVTLPLEESHLYLNFNIFVPVVVIITYCVIFWIIFWLLALPVEYEFVTLTF